MRLLAITFARRSQFSAILERLADEDEVMLLSPPGEAIDPRIEALTYRPERSSDADPVLRTRATYADTAAAIARELEPLRSRGFDVVFAQASFGCARGALDCLDAPVVAHVELPGMELALARPEFPLTERQRAAHEALRSLVAEALRDAAATIAPSAHARSQLPADVQPKVNVCMEGFDPQPPASAQERAALRRRYGFTDRLPIVGYFGRTLEAVRGFDVFARAAARIRAVRPVHLLAVGEPVSLYGKEQERLDGMSFRDYSLAAADLRERDVVFTGFQPRPRVRELMRLADVALFPLFESAGNWSYFEALAVGTPTVASDCAFFPEVVDDGVHGLLAPPGDDERFAARTLELLDEPVLRDRIGRMAHARVAERYTVAHAAAAYRRVFTQARARGRAPAPHAGRPGC